LLQQFFDFLSKTLAGIDFKALDESLCQFFAGEWLPTEQCKRFDGRCVQEVSEPRARVVQHRLIAKVTQFESRCAGNLPTHTEWID
jgi:hypothetical protein